VIQVQQDPTPEEIDELDSPSPPTVPFVKLFVYADGLDWILMSLGSLAAAVHGAALPVFLVYVGKIINLFALYQHDLHMDLQHQLSPASHHSLANEVARVNCTCQSLCLLFHCSYHNSHFKVGMYSINFFEWWGCSMHYTLCTLLWPCLLQDG
jgi:hypothetical protein